MRTFAVFRVTVGLISAAIAYVGAEKLQWLTFSIGPSLKPIYDHLDKGGGLALFFAWFFFLGLGASALVVWMLQWVWRKLHCSFTPKTSVLIGISVAVAWECIDQLRLAKYEELWMLSILNMQRIALAVAFPVMLGRICSRGPNL